jgi:hypothetical protein
MIQRFDQLALDLPEPSGPNPATAAAIQELMNLHVPVLHFRGKCPSTAWAIHGTAATSLPQAI